MLQHMAIRTEISLVEGKIKLLIGFPNMFVMIIAVAKKMIKSFPFQFGQI